MVMENPAPKNPLEPGKSYHGLMALFVAAAAIGFIWLAASINSYTTQMLEEIKGLRQDISDLRDRDLMAKRERAGMNSGDRMMAGDEKTSVFESEYGFRFVTTPECKPQFEVKKIATYPKSAEASYGLYVPLSKQWPKGAELLTYSVMSSKTREAISADELPGRPRILMALNGGLLLTQYDPQDSPEDLGGCALEPELTK